MQIVLLTVDREVVGFTTRPLVEISYVIVQGGIAGRVKLFTDDIQNITCIGSIIKTSMFEYICMDYHIRNKLTELRNDG